MSLSINKYAEGIVMPRTRQVTNQLRNFPDAVNLTIGQPDFPTPNLVKQAGIQAIENDQTTYSPNAGLLSAREAVANFFQKQYNATYDPESEIIMTTGSSEGLDSVFRTILNEGDEVLIPAPTYMSYETMIDLAGAKAVFFDTTDTGFIPFPERLESLITERTKAILFNYPSNPTGAIIPQQTMDKLIAVLEKHDVFILADEIYSENVFDGKHISFASYSSIRERLFLIHGLSKSHSMTGWRVGYVLGPAKIMQYVTRVHAYNSICANLPGQYATIAALGKSQQSPNEMNKAYIKRRNYIYDVLQQLDIDVVLPKGTFYIFPSIKKFGLTSLNFTMRLLKEGGVAVLPGSSFTKYGEGYIRISYSYALPEIERGMKRFKNFVEQLA